MSKQINRHDRLVNLVYNICVHAGLDAQKKVIYPHGEMDVLVRGPKGRIYYEIKSNWSAGNVCKAKKQIYRAIKYNQCDNGYMITSGGLHNIIKQTEQKPD